MKAIVFDLRGHRAMHCLQSLEGSSPFGSAGDLWSLGDSNP